MAMALVNLDPTTRKLMLDEISSDIAGKTLYRSPRLSPLGLRDYDDLLKEAVERHDDRWLAAELATAGRLNTIEERHKPNGGYTTARVPITAPETMAEGEFGRFYLRALCLRALADGTNHLVIYRAKAVMNPRPDSQAKIDTTIDAATLLADLRAHSGVDTALGLPPGPNSGLSARLL
jgi:hypothetical protein